MISKAVNKISLEKYYTSLPCFWNYHKLKIYLKFITRGQIRRGPNLEIQLHSEKKFYRDPPSMKTSFRPLLNVVLIYPNSSSHISSDIRSKLSLKFEYELSDHVSKIHVLLLWCSVLHVRIVFMLIIVDWEYCINVIWFLKSAILFASSNSELIPFKIEVHIFKLKSNLVIKSMVRGQVMEI